MNLLIDFSPNVSLFSIVLAAEPSTETIRAVTEMAADRTLVHLQKLLEEHDQKRMARHSPFSQIRLGEMPKS